jgi:predicted extracellular nuclease
VVNNHFNSKSGDRALFGEFQPPLFDSEIQRTKQAQAVNDFVASLLAVDPDSKVIVLGDLNDFQFSNPINTLEGTILQNLVETLPVEERYSYIYEGNSQTLDHILISRGLQDNLVSFDILHINSEFNYTTYFSDHDPLIVGFSFD